jgi:hypothetical protein
VALYVQIGLACRIEGMAAKPEGRLPAVAGSGRPFRVMFGVASADQSGGVLSHGSLAGFGSSNHGSLQLDLLGGHFAASGAGCCPKGIFGCALSGLELADGCEGHGW